MGNAQSCSGRQRATGGERERGIQEGKGPASATTLQRGLPTGGEGMEKELVRGVNVIISMG